MRLALSLLLIFDLAGLLLSVLLFELLIINTSILVLLVFRNQIVHVRLSLSELHLVHTLTSVPMQESLATEHGSELLANTLEELLDGGGVTNEGRRHLKATRGNGAKSGLDVVGNPLNEVAGVLVLDAAHLVLNLLHGNLTTEDGRAGEVTTVTEVRSSHHVLGVEHLLGELGNGDSAERVSTTAGQRGETDHEEVETGERHHVHSQLAKIRVELTGKTQASSDTGHDGRNEVVQVAIRGVAQLEGTHANIVQSFVIDTEGLVRVLNKLVDGESGVVRLNNGIGNLGGGNDGEGGHHSVGELLTDLGDQKRTHTGTGTTTERVGNLETLKAVAALSLTADNVQNLVNQLGTLGVMALGPVVSGTGLTKDKVVRAEELAEGTSADSVHGTRLEIDEDSTGNILVASSLFCSGQNWSGSRLLGSTSYLVEVDTQTLELLVGGASVDTIGIETVLTRDGLPESSTNLVTL